MYFWQSLHPVIEFLLFTNFLVMKQRSRPLLLLLLGSIIGISAFIFAFRTQDRNEYELASKPACCLKPEEANCVFRTILNLEGFDTAGLTAHTVLVEGAIHNGLDWLSHAQGANGGWGAGSHFHQEIRDPHAVEADPATTALAGMALLRCGNSLTKGEYAVNLKKAMNYLLLAVENASGPGLHITSLTNTQPQIKLGQNIDVILTAQFLSNLMRYIGKDNPLHQRIQLDLDKCIRNIQRGQDQDGGWKEGGWAPVLQSALANNALESAKDIGFTVDSNVLERSRNYQKSNFDPLTDAAVTGKSAGVLLYAISGSSRASAKEARTAKEKIDLAKKEGRLKLDDKINEENLVKAGMNRPDAKKYITAYEINQAASSKAQGEDIMSGFGSNGGEEFISYLMTGESLVMNGGHQWEKWYEKMTGRLMQIQNNEGSWSGHHCITSPVFCTATCLLVLSINQDIDFLSKADSR
jgi:hypothetical protein